MNPLAAPLNLPQRNAIRSAHGFAVVARRSALAPWLWAVLILAVLVRLLSIGAYPLMGTSEPRYAEIARLMLQTGDWVTPWLEPGVPFWGKPPLSFWGSAVTMAVFGVNEFGARLAPVLASLATVALLWTWPDTRGRRPALRAGASVVMLTSLAGFLATGFVVTDMFMTLGTTLSMVAGWHALQNPPRRTPWAWLFFLGLVIGLLAKGPVAMVITGLAMGGWAMLAPRQRLPRLWAGLPWTRGLALTLLLALPWYLLAELRTPGFLHYFVVGEHLQRFLVSGWGGDLYGFGHAQPRGMIWWFLFSGLLPWSPLALGLAVWLRSSRAAADARDEEPALRLERGERDYLLAWLLATPLFFTAACNILEAYVLPSLPAFALLTGALLLRLERRDPRLRWGCVLGLLSPALLAAAVLLWPQALEGRSQCELLEHWAPGTPLVYLGARPLSANFYSRGQARVVVSGAAIEQQLRSSPVGVSVVMPKPSAERRSALQQGGWQWVAEGAGFAMFRRALVP